MLAAALIGGNHRERRMASWLESGVAIIKADNPAAAYSFERRKENMSAAWWPHCPAASSAFASQLAGGWRASRRGNREHVDSPAARPYVRGVAVGSLRPARRNMPNGRNDRQSKIARRSRRGMRRVASAALTPGPEMIRPCALAASARREMLKRGSVGSSMSIWKRAAALPLRAHQASHDALRLVNRTADAGLS